MVPPAQFIPIAEETGLIAKIGEWVLKQGTKDASGWPDDLKVAINVPARQLTRDDFLTTFLEALKGSGLPAWRLDLELTETAMMENDGANAALLNQIRALGISISIDDFGTGYSSLSYIHRFPIDRIKIDRPFVVALEAENSSVSIIRAIIALADALRLRTVAEGVETQAQLELLTRLGCTEAQGFLIGRPAPVQEAIAQLEAAHNHLARLETKQKLQLVTH